MITGSTGGLGDDKMNSHFKSLLDDQLDSMDSSGEDVKDQPRRTPPGKHTTDGPMKGDLMNWTEVLESMDDISVSVANMPGNVSDEPISDNGGDNEKELLAELNQLFTPILVMQGFENDVSDKIQESFSDASVITERNVIQFDDETRMAQLIATCALLLQKKKNTAKYQTYKKAALLRNQLKLEMQKEEYEAAKALAQKFLVNVATTNNSSVARDSANRLLPATQS